MKVLTLVDVPDVAQIFRTDLALAGAAVATLKLDGSSLLDIALSVVNDTDFSVTFTAQNLTDIKALGKSTTARVQIDARITEEFILEVS